MTAVRGVPMAAVASQESLELRFMHLEKLPFVRLISIVTQMEELAKAKKVLWGTFEDADEVGVTFVPVVLPSRNLFQDERPSKRRKKGGGEVPDLKRVPLPDAYVVFLWLRPIERTLWAGSVWKSLKPLTIYACACASVRRRCPPSLCIPS